MSIRLSLALGLAGALAAVGPAHAQEPGAASLTHWQFFAEVAPPEKGEAKYYLFTLPPAVLGQAQRELGDLRLVDANGLVIPYARRVRVARQEQQTLNAEAFDQGTNAAEGYTQVSLRLPAQDRPEHNEVEVATAGQQYRRRVVVFASDQETFPPGDTREIADDFVFRLDTDAGPVQRRVLKYPPQQARFLRVRVYADPALKEKAPKIEQVVVRQTVNRPGVDQTLPANLWSREPVPTPRGPGSAWFVELSKDPVPVTRLTLTVAGAAVQRPFRLETAGDEDEPRREMVEVTWRWRKEGEKVQLVAEFPEVRARKLRLVVTDFANPPLEIESATYGAPARQIIFTTPAGAKLAWPLKLYFGNRDATPAEYDLERNLPAELTPVPLALAVGDVRENPGYVPPARSLGERLPWLVYVVLSVACLVLVALLGLLARQALRRHDARQAEVVPRV